MTDGTTHWDGCHAFGRKHYDCLLNHCVKVQNERDAFAAELSEANKRADEWKANWSREIDVSNALRDELTKLKETYVECGAEMIRAQQRYEPLREALVKIAERDSSEFIDAHRGLVRIAREALRGATQSRRPAPDIHGADPPPSRTEFYKCDEPGCDEMHRREAERTAGQPPAGPTK